MELLVVIIVLIIAGTILYGIVTKYKKNQNSLSLSSAPIIEESKQQIVETVVVSTPEPVAKVDEASVTAKKPRKTKTVKTETKPAKKPGRKSKTV